MKPLTKNSIDEFLKRFEQFKDGEFRSIEINSPTSITLSFSAQDSSRGYDWVGINLQFDEVTDASLLDNSKLEHVDMSDGISIYNNGTKFAFVVNNSTCQIKSSYLKYEEVQF